jgi:hypothetical protein
MQFKELFFILFRTTIMMVSKTQDCLDTRLCASPCLPKKEQILETGFVSILK